MRILERIFASYYFFFVWLRKIIRKLHLPLYDRSEDDAALGVLVMAELFLITLFAGLVKKIYFFTLPRNFVWAWLAFYALLVVVQLRYFITNRTRRRTSIEDFRNMPRGIRHIWHVVSIAIIILPFISFVFLFRTW